METATGNEGLLVNVDEIPLVSSENLAFNQNECSICYQKIEPGIQVRILPCNHAYHDDCIRGWFRIESNCPICRLELPRIRLRHESSGVNSIDSSANIYIRTPSVASEPRRVSSSRNRRNQSRIRRNQSRIRQNQRSQSRNNRRYRNRSSSQNSRD
ncbi:hypothetical protein PVAND_004059 [Polypedilum vanderplanki]|uniref:RING-type domain-containing protein n=1 Tax=Polypedilum vanderplanki TaxID=319348 RepID=A0A9J6BWK3_POLVA|nr:hypothetical protein PVAND_004059 [Polypedilum vanderplanki]